MRLSIATLAACASAAQAFSDTSPFLLFSNSPLPNELSSASTAQLQSSVSVLETAKSFLKGCPSELYIIVSQPSLTSSDVSSPDSLPHLKRALKDPGVQSRYSVADVVGLKNVDTADIASVIRSQCKDVVAYELGQIEEWGMRKIRNAMISVNFADLPADEEKRKHVLADNDAALDTALTEGLKAARYTVIYKSTPPSAPIQRASDTEFGLSDVAVYEPEFQHLEHLDLKRDLYVRKKNSSSNATSQLPLFEKYQFLTPGLFMGLLVGLILVAILSVGISAIASLEVSYGAFDKEMGPAAQKKQ